MKNTSQRLNQIMKERKLKQVDILNMSKIYQEQLGVNLSKSHLSQYVNGKSSPDQHKLYLLSKTLNVSEAWLMGYDVPKEKENFSSINEIGMKLYNIYLDECPKESFKFKALNYYKDSYKLEKIVELAVYNVLSIPILYKKLEDIENMINLYNHVLVKASYLDTFINQYISNEKNDFNLLYKITNELKDMLPYEDYQYYSDKIELHYGDDEGILISLKEKNLSIDLILEIQKILTKSIEDIESLKKKYTNTISNKLIEYIYMDANESSLIIEPLGTKDLPTNSFKSKEELQGFIIESLNEIVYLNQDNIDPDIKVKLLNNKIRGVNIRMDD